MNDTQFWCLGTGEQMLFGWCDWSSSHFTRLLLAIDMPSLDSNTIYTTKRFACDEPAPTLLEMTIYWIVEAFTEHPDVCPSPTVTQNSSSFDPRTFTAR